MEIRSDEIDRFRRFLAPAGDCTLWVGARNSDGYGVFRRRPGAGLVLAHRFYYELTVGDIDPTHELDHTCGIRHCVTHTQAVTHIVNCQRAAARRKARP